MFANLKAHLGLFLFSLPFAGVGLGFLLLSILPSLQEWQQMASWPQVEAQLQHAKLEHNRGDDSDTYEAVARYTYTYNGRSYHSSRVAIMSGSDNIGDFQQRLAAQLEADWRAQRTVPAWVNPDDPADAVLNRDMRWGALGFRLLFAVIFGGVGIGMLGYALLAKPSLVDHPDAASKPWLARREWADNHIVCNARGSLWLVWLFALLWNAISVPVLFAVPAELAKQNYLILLGLLFPLIGLLLLFWAIKTTLGVRRFGQLVLVMDPFPGSIGGQMAGHIDLPLPLDSQQAVAVKLSCLRSYVTGSGKNRSRSESLVWQSDGVAELQPSVQGTRLTFCFDVPEGLPASEPHSSDYHLWRLGINADLPGVDLERQFEIPLYPTAEQARARLRSSAQHPKAIEHRIAQIESVLDYREIPGGVELFSPMLRNPSGWIFGLVFGAIFAGAGVGMYHAADAPGILVWSFTLVGGLILLFTLKSMFTSIRVRLDSQGLTSQRHWLGIASGRDEVARAEISKLEIHSQYKQQSGGKHVEVCGIRALTRDGKKIPLAKNLQGREVAQQALEAIAGRCGFPLE